MKNYVKVQDLLGQYLYQHKSLTLPGIGTFELNPSINVQEIKDQAWPPDTITFQHNQVHIFDEQLLQYLVEHSGKMKPLAHSDLESYLNNGMQLLNIGKPFTIKGIGSIVKTGHSSFSFQQGLPNSEPPQTEYVLKDRTRQKTEIQEQDFSYNAPTTSKKLIVILGSVLALCLIVWVVYLLLPGKNSATDTDPALDTTNLTPVVQTDTILETTPDTTILQPVATQQFKLVLENGTKEKMTARVAKLNTLNHKVVLETTDSIQYAVVLYIPRPLSDTTAVKDSLSRIFGPKIQILSN